VIVSRSKLDRFTAHDPVRYGRDLSQLTLLAKTSRGCYEETAIRGTEA